MNFVDVVHTGKYIYSSSYLEMLFIRSRIEINPQVESICDL